MVVLKAIGRFFARIGRWIKETAWVQPLLIVGGVFVIIFSISPITNWVQSWFTKGDASASYFGTDGFVKSLDGSKDGNSEADKLFYYIENYSSASEADKSKYGTKFFIAFVENNCSYCDATYKGFETLQNNWNKGTTYAIDDGNPFRLHSIFVDSKDPNDDKINYFTEYFWNNHSDFFEEAATCTENSPYYKNKISEASSSYKDQLEHLAGMATDNNAPIYFLIDLDNTEIEWQNQYGIGNIMFVYSNDEKCGSTSYDKASYLADCWNYKGVFGKSE